MYRAGVVTVEAAMIEVALMAAIGIGLYLSYRLILIINRVLA